MPASKKRVSGIANHEIRKMSLSELIPLPDNPRRIRPENQKALKASMTKWGCVEPIIWNKRTGHVVGGHQRLEILRQMDTPETNVIVVDLDESSEKGLAIALNSPTLAGEFDQVKLEKILSSMNKVSTEILDSINIKELLNECAEAEKSAPPMPIHHASESKLQKFILSREASRNAGKDKNDVAFYAVLVFQSQQQKLAFLSNMTDVGVKYSTFVNGNKFAEKFGISIPPHHAKLSKTRPEQGLSDRVMK